MTAKTLSSVVGNQATRQLTLPNLDGVVHAAGTRGVLAKSIFQNSQWGFTPLENKGLTKTFNNATMALRWYPGMDGQFHQYNGVGGGCATTIASNGDCLVAAWLQPNNWNQTNPSNEDLYIYAMDATTGDIADTLAITDVALSYNSGSPLNDAECIMAEVEDKFFICAVRHRLTSGYWQVAGFNYDASTQTLSVQSGSSQLVTGSQTLMSTTKAHFSLNNAGTELAVLLADGQERCEWFTIPVTGAAGARELGATMTIADQVSFDGAGLMNFKMGGRSHIHRLSNDDVIVFGHMITGTGTTIHYSGAGKYWINIMDANVSAITQNYYLEDEVPGATESKKHYYHGCVYSWEIAEDTYIVLSKSQEKNNPVHGPADYWSDNDGYNHVRAYKIVVDPLDNTLTQTNLGEFHRSLFKGNLIMPVDTADWRSGVSSVYDWAIDITNKCVYMITKQYVTRLQFNSDWTATDPANCDIQFAPQGPKAPNISIVGSTELYDPATREQQQVYDGPLRSEHTYAFDLANKKLWKPGWISYNNDSALYYGAATLLSYDMEQCSGSDAEVVVASADANEVQCIADFDCFDNNGVPVGTQIGNTMAVTVDQVVATRPLGHILDVLISDVMSTAEAEDYLYVIPANKILFNPLGVVDTNTEAMRINKGRATWAVQLGSNIWNADDCMVFHRDGMESTQEATYEGPFFSYDNLDTDMWVWFEGDNDVANEGSLLLVIDGWWAAGASGCMPIDTSSGNGGIKTVWQLRPSSHIELNGHAPDTLNRMYAIKFQHNDEVIL